MDFDEQINEGLAVAHAQEEELLATLRALLLDDDIIILEVPC